MSRKTKADKIANSIRQLRNSEAKQTTQKTDDSQFGSMSGVDAVKTFVTSLFVVSLITLVYVLQIRGYIG